MLSRNCKFFALQMRGAGFSGFKEREAGTERRLEK